MTATNQPGGPTKIKGKQGVREAAEGEEKLIDQFGKPSEPQPEASPQRGEPLREGQGAGDRGGPGEKER